jgi:hypothetical protein
MKLKLTDGHLIDPYIIWGELDHRGFVSLGFKTEDDFCDLSPLVDLAGRKQLIRNETGTTVFVSFPLAAFTPKCSVFNLDEEKLLSFYRETYEGAQEELMRTFFRLGHLCPGYKFKALDEKDLARTWHHYFNPLSPIPDELYNPTFSILENCLPEQNLKESGCGFELNGCLHHFITIKRCRHHTEVVQKLNAFPLTINLTEFGNQILIGLHETSQDELNRKATQVKELLHTLPGTDYYEANDCSENLRLFEQAIPGWIFGVQESCLREATT